MTTTTTKLTHTEDPIALHAAGFDGYRVMLSRVCDALASDCADVRDLAQRAATMLRYLDCVDATIIGAHSTFQHITDDAAAVASEYEGIEHDRALARSRADLALEALAEDALPDLLCEALAPFANALNFAPEDAARVGKGKRWSDVVRAWAERPGASAPLAAYLRAGLQRRWSAAG